MTNTLMGALIAQGQEFAQGWNLDECRLYRMRMSYDIPRSLHRDLCRCFCSGLRVRSVQEMKHSLEWLTFPDVIWLGGVLFGTGVSNILWLWFYWYPKHRKDV